MRRRPWACQPRCTYRPPRPRSRWRSCARSAPPWCSAGTSTPRRTRPRRSGPPTRVRCSATPTTSRRSAPGRALVGLEFLDQVEAVDTVLIAVGGGGLMAGVAAALDGHAGVVAVEPEKIPTLHAALAAGGPVDVEVSGVAADSLGARRVGTIAYDVAVRCGCAACWSRTRPSSPPVSRCGTSTGWSSSTAPPPRLPHWPRARTCRSRRAGRCAAVRGQHRSN